MNERIASIRRSFFRIGIAWTLSLLSLSVMAGPLTSKDENKIIEVVQAQLDAFAADDAQKAFGYAAPNIRSLMGSAQNFLEVVRKQYEVVYRPSTVMFLKPRGIDNEAVLKAHMNDQDGEPWVVTYTLQRQKSKTWRITGCVVNEVVGTTI